MWLPNSDQQLRNRREMNFFIYMAMISNFLISNKQEQRKLEKSIRKRRTKIKAVRRQFLVSFPYKRTDMHACRNIIHRGDIIALVAKFEFLK
jgi:hypothetical protein